jgi:hypothetical protein
MTGFLQPESMKTIFSRDGAQLSILKFSRHHGYAFINTKHSRQPNCKPLHKGSEAACKPVFQMEGISLRK